MRLEKAPHKGLKVWQQSIELAKEIYKLTEYFPKSELFGLTLQIRRATVSIASNIAEGSARQTDKEKIQFYYIARGSLSELDTQIEISYKIGFLNENDKTNIFSYIDEIGRLLSGLINIRKVCPNN